jgi:AcrR family transcriptional regulator
MKKEKEKYQHGNLAKAILEDAMALIKEVPASEISLRELAVRAGVSPRAPYVHFPSKSDLLKQMARSGFDIMAERTADSEIDLVALGEVYVQFALENPHLFRLMFGGILALDCAEMPGESFMHLANAVGKLNTEMSEEELLNACMGLWCLVHGLASLRIESMATDSPTLAQMMDGVRVVLAAPKKG